MTRETAYCFGADLGGTKLAAAMADARGRIVAELTEPTDPRGGAFVAEQIAACADKLAQSAGIEVTRARHVMVGIPGAVDPLTGRISQIPNIAGLEDFDVLGYLRRRFGPDVAIENDVNLAMLGEQALGCASGCRNAAFLSLGTGAGLGLLLNDRLFHGARGAAGEIADLPVARDPTSHVRLPRAHSSSRWARSPSSIDTDARVAPRPSRCATFSGSWRKATRWQRRSSTRRRAVWPWP